MLNRALAYAHAYLVSVVTRVRNSREDKGGETLQNTIWILVGLAIALIVGWIFFKEQIKSFAETVWKNLTTWSTGQLNPTQW